MKCDDDDDEDAFPVPVAARRPSHFAAVACAKIPSALILRLDSRLEARFEKMCHRYGGHVVPMSVQMLVPRKS